MAKSKDNPEQKDAEHFLLVRIRCADKYMGRATQYVTDAVLSQRSVVAGLKLEVKNAKPRLQQSGSEQPQRKETAASGQASEGDAGKKRKARVSKRKASG